jgi:hypothetical protein
MINMMIYVFLKMVICQFATWKITGNSCLYSQTAWGSHLSCKWCEILRAFLRWVWNMLPCVNWHETKQPTNQSTNQVYLDRPRKSSLFTWSEVFRRHSCDKIGQKIGFITSLLLRKCGLHPASIFCVVLALLPIWKGCGSRVTVSN